MTKRSLEEQAHDLQTALAAATAAARTLQSRWARLTEAQKVELVDVTVRRTEELEAALQPVLARIRSAGRQTVAGRDATTVISSSDPQATTSRGSA